MMGPAASAEMIVPTAPAAPRKPSGAAGVQGPAAGPTAAPRQGGRNCQRISNPGHWREANRRGYTRETRAHGGGGGPISSRSPATSGPDVDRASTRSRRRNDIGEHPRKDDHA